MLALRSVVDGVEHVVYMLIQFKISTGLPKN